MNKDQLIEKLKEIIALHDPLAQVHENYDRTVALAKLYSQIISGKDIDKLLKQFVRREDTVMFEQRVNLTQQITPSISATIIKTFNKVFRTTPATEVVDFDGDNVDESIAEVKTALKTIYGRKDIYKYLQDKFLYLSFVDPNSFIYTTFDSFDPTKEKPAPFNKEISSEQAINYEYFNNELQWLITKTDHVFLENDKETDGFIYTIYGPEWGFVMTQVGEDYISQTNEVIEKIVINETKTEYYIFTSYEHKSSVIPVIQVGYERDIETEGAIFVSPIHWALPYFMKTIKTVSEFDLTMCLHAFPKLFQYVDKCDFTTNGKCTSSGKNMEHCKLCNSTGIKVHTSAQDAIYLKMPPKDVPASEIMDLSKMIHVETPSIELLSFQDTIIDKYEVKIIRSVFNSERFKKDEIAKTATGENIDMQNVYDTLKPFAEKISDVWEHVARVISYYLDHPDPIVAHAYPNDFKFKTLGELIAELRLATEAGAGGYITSSLQNDIMRIIYIDSPLEFQKYEAKQKFFPFNGKNKEEIQDILMSNQVREKDKVLYNYFDLIFQELENEYLAQNPPLWFYDIEYNAQRLAIYKKIEEISAEIGTATELQIS